jgi:hypothetical protein
VNQDKGKKVKVKLSLCLTKHRAMKTYWESRGIAPRILYLEVRGQLHAPAAWLKSFRVPQSQNPLTT